MGSIIGPLADREPRRRRVRGIRTNKFLFSVIYREPIEYLLGNGALDLWGCMSRRNQVVQPQGHKETLLGSMGGWTCPDRPGRKVKQKG